MTARFVAGRRQYSCFVGLHNLPMRETRYKRKKNEEQQTLSLMDFGKVESFLFFFHNPRGLGLGSWKKKKKRKHGDTLVSSMKKDGKKKS